MYGPAFSFRLPLEYLDHVVGNEGEQGVSDDPVPIGRREPADLPVDGKLVVEVVLDPPTLVIKTVDVEWAIDFYRDSGAIEFADGETQALIDRANAVVETLPLPDSGKDAFRVISRYIVDRSS